MACAIFTLTGLILPPALEVFGLCQPHAPSRFTQLESLMQLHLPASLKRLILPPPLRSAFPTHPSRPAYQAWLIDLTRTRPALHLQFSSAVYESDSSDSTDDEVEEGASWKTTTRGRTRIMNDRRTSPPIRLHVIQVIGLLSCSLQSAAS